MYSRRQLLPPLRELDVLAEVANETLLACQAASRQNSACGGQRRPHRLQLSSNVSYSEAEHNRRNKRTEFGFVSLFSGAGGLDIGFTAAGFYPVWVNDIDGDAIATHDAYFGRWALPHVSTVGDIREKVLPARGAAGLVIGGPPCQGFSVAGKMDPHDPRSQHVWDFVQAVRDLQPHTFVMENVMALATNRRWAGLREDLISVARDELGYDTAIWILRASHFGVPQNRDRMFLVGTRCGALVPPDPLTADSLPTVGAALRALPRFGSPGNDTFASARITLARTPVMRRSPFAGMLFNGQGRPLNLEAPASTLPATMGGNRTPIVDQLTLDTGATPWVVDYHRRLMNGRAPSKRVPSRLRRLTVEEAAAIQTFPPDVTWTGSTSSKFRQIGNAVPPTLAFHVGKSIRRLMDQTSVTNG